MEITIYTTTNCGICHALMSWLDKQNVTYQEKNVESDGEAMAEFMQVNEGMIGTPFSVVTRESGEVDKIPGFDQGRFKKLIQS